MNKLSCDIIKDLIPLYIDEICSEDSAKAVTAHLESCPACKGYYDGMSTEIIKENISPETVSEVKAIKKIRNHYIGIMAFWTVILSTAMLVWGLNLKGGDEMGFSLIVFYFLFPLASLVFSAVMTAKKSLKILLIVLIILLAQIFLPFFIFRTFEIALAFILTLVPACIGAIIGLIIGNVRNRRK